MRTKSVQCVIRVPNCFDIFQSMNFVKYLETKKYNKYDVIIIDMDSTKYVGSDVIGYIMDLINKYNRQSCFIVTCPRDERMRMISKPIFLALQKVYNKK